MKKLKTWELERKSVEQFKNASKQPIVIVLDNIRSLNNIGSVFRTADAFLVKSIFLTGFTAIPPHKDIHKTALGATESVEWKYFKKGTEAVKELKNENYKVYSVEQTDKSIPLSGFYPDGESSIALVFGNEVKGVSQEIIEISSGCIEIPQFGTKHSFNIAVSAGIVLWDLYTKRKTAPL